MLHLPEPGCPFAVGTPFSAADAMPTCRAKPMRALATALCLLIAPDILPENAKGIRSSNRLELGVLADHAFVQCVVEKGDTLTSIAKTRLGAATRTQDVLAANPGIDPDHLRIGQRIWLPPKDASTKDPVYLFLGLPFRQLAPLIPTAPLPYTHYGRYTLYLVPAPYLSTWQKNSAINNWDAAVAAMVKEQKVQALEGASASHYVPTNSPIAREESTLVVEKDKDGKLALRQTIVCFDKYDKRIEAGKARAEGVGTEPKKESILLLLVAFGGGAWLLLRTRGRRPAPALA